MKYIWILIFCFSVANAIVTIRPVEIGEKPGINGKLNASLESKRGNTNKNVYNLGVRVQYDNSSDYVLWTDLSGSYAEVSGKNNTNKIYGHIRYVHSLYKTNLNWETFAQLEANEFTKIKRRRLLGLGLRYRVFNNKFGKLYFGMGGFNEVIFYTTKTDKYENNIRINHYLAYTKKFDKKSTLSYVIYYQPNIAKNSDFMLSNRVELNINIYKKLSLSIRVYYDVDSKPAVGVKKEDITQKTSFIFKF